MINPFKISLPQSQDETGVSGYATEMLTSPDIIPIPVGNITLWYHYGAQGETRYLTDEQGAIADTYRYDAYGNPVFATGVYYNPHRYGGRYGYHSNLNPAGLVLAGARWYSPNLRRWMSRDPIGYEGGHNLYSYVDNKPVNYLDPMGYGPEDDNGASLEEPELFLDPVDWLAGIVFVPIRLSSFAIGHVLRIEEVSFGRRLCSQVGAIGSLRRKPGKFGMFKGTRGLRHHNKQFRDVARKLNLTLEQQEQLHREVSFEGLNYQELYQRALELFEK